ncbi:alpha/beta-hydrolase [Penicillium macrosclerotiorum]|uniref:alpha/beta-hydrolase n=1 Tax=Penicillium macrosclerotiorum TaxID=303699 RepID=UPI0025469CDD|nr:alpha/beta-hydrolase [Penicillium macrosclerotiorum]KAJ5679739.1 alpha/beta-hydrolase [Penicillium macrosclerotiorum]
MSFQTPSSKATIHVKGLGQLDGFRYETGVEQFCGIPYADLAKRWTRSTLKTSWNKNYHDGTQLGNDCAAPLVEGDTSDILVPVPPNPHFPRQPEIDEKSALVMNIVVPEHPTAYGKRFPVFFYIHGGSLLYTGANLGVFDGVNLVSQSVSMNQPIIVVNFNYRVGLGGFLASSKIADELRQDGFKGNGNFGFTDQQVAFEWVQKYIAELGGDPENVTAVGESAGGISISHQLTARNPPKFHRAICMSGVFNSLHPAPLARHEEIFNATCRYFSIDPLSPTVMDQLRGIGEQELANADHIIQGVFSGTGNPCDDGWFYNDRTCLHPETPTWIKSLMIGDVYHEGIIFGLNLAEDTYNTVKETLVNHIQDESLVDSILLEYAIEPSLNKEALIERVSHLGGDAAFKIPNWQVGLHNKRLQSQKMLFKYHFDQRSRLKNELEGTAYHAHELLYLFGNLKNEMNETEIAMSRDFASAWIEFVNGGSPWTSGEGLWKIWGPESVQSVKSEEEDEVIRLYSRFKRLQSLGNDDFWRRFLSGIDDLLMKRSKIGQFGTRK